jgi:queuine tRNA-ribosyltransferase
MKEKFKFDINFRDQGTKARSGKLDTPHGTIDTPAFMPVGTKGTVKTLRPKDLKNMNVQILLGNTYHLSLKPGLDVIEAANGLHNFMRWDRPILTDSGGFQVFSLADSVVIDEDGVTFKTGIDGGLVHRLTPEEVVRIQGILGSDIMMPLDHVLPPTDKAKTDDAMYRTIRWAERAVKAAQERKDQVLFPIIQGGVFEDSRRKCCQELSPMASIGIAIGGLSVGETKSQMAEMIDVCESETPDHLVRYLMGVGSPEDLVDSIGRGVDIFDCVLPTRIARTGSAFTPEGRVSMRLEKWKYDQDPIDKDCLCEACHNFSRSYIRHLIMEKEVLGMVLLSIHNISYLLQLMKRCRTEIENGNYANFRQEFLARYKPMGNGED